MLVDFRQHNKRDIETQICIIGAGAAGITLGLAMVDAGLQCHILESGGLLFDSGIQALGEVENGSTGNQRACHLRYFGGATNHWGGWCAPLNNQDFENRSWIPLSGWPIDRTALDPYYADAQSICGLGSAGYTPESLSDRDHDFRPFNNSVIKTHFYQYSLPPRRFGLAYKSTLESANNLSVLLHANVAWLETSRDASTVEAAVLRNTDGTTGRVRAKHFVVACGGIQNARLLLLSNHHDKRGLGNRQDMVGRCFMQHPHTPCASILANDSEALAQLFGMYELSGSSVRASLSLTPEQQQQKQVMNASATIDKTADPASGYGALRYLWREIKRGRWPDDFEDRVRTVLSDLGSIENHASWLTLYMRSEQQPNKDSRVSLGNTLDALGLPVAKVDWSLTRLDKHTIYASTKKMGEELAHLNLGRLRFPDWLTRDDNTWSSELWGGCHHMGTTRMSDSEATGVVDSDCRMHAVENLFIAGSSVFPTSGYANPTLSIVALTLRLADHLKKLNA